MPHPKQPRSAHSTAPPNTASPRQGVQTLSLPEYQTDPFGSTTGTKRATLPLWKRTRLGSAPRLGGARTIRLWSVTPPASFPRNPQYPNNLPQRHKFLTASACAPPPLTLSAAAGGSTQSLAPAG